MMPHKIVTGVRLGRRCGIRARSSVREWCSINIGPRRKFARPRSEEHTSELQSLRHLVCRLLLEKKPKTKQNHNHRDLHAPPTRRSSDLAYGPGAASGSGAASISGRGESLRGLSVQGAVLSAEHQQWPLDSPGSRSAASASFRPED